MSKRAPKAVKKESAKVSAARARARGASPHESAKLARAREIVGAQPAASR